MASAAGTLGIITCGGELPIAIAEAVSARGGKVYLLAINGIAQPDGVAPFKHDWVSLGEFGKALKLLKAAGCAEITMAGDITRPRWDSIKPDARGVFALPGVVMAATKGDDALLRHVMGMFEREGFRIVGSADAAKELLAPEGLLGKRQPNEQDRADMSHGFRVVRAMGALDIGQAAAVCNGLVLAVEAAEGTDAMLARILDLPASVRGTSGSPRGVLVKAPKPHQDRRVDLPVIGLKTVERVAAAGLAGIAVEAGSSLIMNRRKVAQAADDAGIFVIGFPPEAAS
jgi:UDP-2,3-diacylglucosamine hydrolase